MKYNDTKTSKFISLILRHKPEAINKELRHDGYMLINDLIEGMNNKGYNITINDLDRIVREDGKQRYSFNDDKTLIRANQGHSIPVDVELEEKQPPKYLYHGTADRFLDSIMTDGLKPMSRLYVHLSKDEETAMKVGKRHGKPIVLKIKSEEMYNDGIKFYLSQNSVWLTKYVDMKYIETE